jgi:hypothetical protein
MLCVYYYSTYYRCLCVFITAVPITKRVCLLLQYLLQSCSRGGETMEDICYESLRAEARHAILAESRPALKVSFNRPGPSLARVTAGGCVCVCYCST